MCGLSGVMGAIGLKEEKAFKTLLIFSQVRGQDSTGIGSVARSNLNNHRDMKLAKETGPPYFLFDTKSFDRCFHTSNQMYLGHNRSRTIGEATRKNAHPFLFEDILGAHNGTIDYQNKNRLESGGSFKTDSEAIFNNIQVHGIENTINRIEKTEAYALVWYDKRDNTLNFIRNTHRPLIYAYANKRKTLFWASEFALLTAALSREEIAFDKPYIVSEDTHYSWKIPTTEFEDLPEPTRTKYENHKHEPYYNSAWKKNPKTGTWENASTGSLSGNLGAFNWDNYPPEEADTCLLPQDITQNMQHNSIETVVTPQEKKTNDPVGFLKRRKLAEYLLPKHPDKMPILYKNSEMVVHRDRDTGMWHVLRWDAQILDWVRFINATPPIDMPFDILDINARHSFLHQGKGKNKKIFYKGFKGRLLNQEDFTKIAEVGCLSCDRKPSWGNDVVFLDNTHAFLCQYCSMTPNLLNDLKSSRKKVG